MSGQRHIINRQVLEIELPANVDVETAQQGIADLYREQIVPLIDRMCDLHSRPGTQCKIESLTLDLGTLHPNEFVAAFAEKFAEALSEQPVALAAEAGNEAEIGSEDRTPERRRPVEVLSYYLLTGFLPWWSEVKKKEDLVQLFDQLLQAREPLLKAVLLEMGHRPERVQRFVSTFSEAQKQVSFQWVMEGGRTADLPALKTELSTFFRQASGQLKVSPSEDKVDQAFWSAVFTYVAKAGPQPGLEGFVIEQTLDALGVKEESLANMLSHSSAAQGLTKWVDSRLFQDHKMVTSLRQKIQSLAENHLENALIQATVRQLKTRVAHPLFRRLPANLKQELASLLESLIATMDGLKAVDSKVLRPLTEANLAPLAQHLHLQDTQMKRMVAEEPGQVLESMHSSFDVTDFVTVENAGLVIFWPFLQRFFANLGLTEEKQFKDETAQHKAACVLQYLLGEAEEEVFEGQMPLNKILCGIPLNEPVELSPLTEEDQAMADGLLEAIISHGPLWKNLSIPSLQASYLQRQASLRSRDGHWLLQVQKETFDVTLEKLPWGFNTIKLPWMNEILIVEWL